MDATNPGQCRSCGAALGAGQFCEKCGADQQALSFDADVARVIHSDSIRSATSSLLWVGILMAAGGVLGFAIGGGEDVLGFGINLGISAFYFGLWHWSKQQPLGATAAGLGVFVTLHVASAVIDPATIAQGLVLKIVVLVLLVRGVRAGVMLRSHGAQNP